MINVPKNVIVQLKRCLNKVPVLHMSTGSFICIYIYAVQEQRR